jgi:hypothetical protein
MSHKFAIAVCCLSVFVGCKSSDKSSSSSSSTGKPDSALLPATQPTAQAAASHQTPATQPVAAHFGGAQKLSDADAVPVEKVLASPANYSNKYVRLTGLVGAVCPAKGCWLRVVPEPGTVATGDVFVKFPDPPEGRLVPMEAVGHDVTVEGVIRNGQISEAQAKHLRQDAGASQAELDKIVGPQQQVMVIAPAVTIEGVPQKASN